MNSINVDKIKLLAVLKENMARHNKIFLDALKGYREKVIQILDKNLQQAINGERIVTSVLLNEPVDQTGDYERVIGMLEMANEAIVELSEQDYSRFVLDKWDWSQNFHSINSGYTTYDRIPNIRNID